MQTLLRQDQVLREEGVGAWIEFDEIKFNPGTNTLFSQNLILPQQCLQKR